MVSYRTAVTVTLLVAVAVEVRVAAAARREESPMQKVTPPATAATCLERFTVEHSHSVLTEQRGVGPGWNDFPSGFAAATIDATALVPVQVVAGFRVDGSPILWFTVDRRAAVVDARVVGDLTAVDATRLRVGESAAVGRVQPDGRRVLPGREIARFLVLAGVIRVYAHVEAEVCLESEHTGPDGAYEVVVSGTHVYFTDDRNEDSFAFVLRVAPDGSISIEGR